MNTPATRPPIPAKISAAICAIMAEVKNIAYTARNTQGGYDFASIDDFMEEVRPLLGKHALAIVQDEESVEIRPGEGTTSAGKERGANVVCEYSFTLSVGAETWAHRPRRTAIVLAAMGPQALGAAQSYAEKLFLRSLFKISTGAPDVDGSQTDELGATGTEAIGRAAKALFEQRLAGIQKAANLAEAKTAWADVQRDWTLFNQDDRDALIRARDERRAELAAMAAAKPAPKPELTPPAEQAPPAPDDGLVHDMEDPEPPADGPEVTAASTDPFASLDLLEEQTKAVPPGRPGAKRS